ncbi:MAG: hypothetical protein AAF849_21550 [Bacteroidota bacterium]
MKYFICILVFLNFLNSNEVTNEEINECVSLFLKSEIYKPYIVKIPVQNGRDSCIVMTNGNGISPNSLTSYLDDCVLYYALSEMPFIYDIPIYNLVKRIIEEKENSMILIIGNESWGASKNLNPKTFECKFTKVEKNWMLEGAIPLGG